MEVSGRAEALAADLRVQAQQLGEIRGRALAIAMLSWDSPAGANFRSYLRERCGEILRSIDLLESAAHHLGGYGDQLRAADLLHGGVRS
jgi:hypothetical protein